MPVRSVALSWCCVLSMVLATGCESARPAPPATSKAAAKQVILNDALVQFSLIAALAAGDYVDGLPLEKLLQSGDFGIGTFDRLDGEMIVLEGQVFQALSDGTVRVANPQDSTPFAAVTFFQEDGRIEKLAAATLEDLDEQLDRKLPRRNVPYALRIDGEFAELTLRSVPAQQPPFEPLVDVVKHQATWQKQNVRGTLIGLRCPPWVGTLNVPGYHWHFLSDDRQIGGHLLACQFKEGLLRYDECTSLVIHVPTSEAFEAFDTNRVKGQDIHEIERQRAPAGNP